MTSKEKRMAFAKKVYQAAIGGEIHPLFVTAKSVLETSWGAKVPGENNVLGITKGSWTGPIDMVITNEYFANDRKKLTPPDIIIRKVQLDINKWQYTVKRAFRHYESIKECIDDYVSILKKPIYDEAWQYKDNPLMFALKTTNNLKSKYSTTSSYYLSLRALIITLGSKEEWLKKVDNENE